MKILELAFSASIKKRTAVRSVLSVNSVLKGKLNTVKVEEVINIIEYFGDEPGGVNVFNPNPGGEGKNFEIAKEGPANGQGNGEGMNLDERTKSLVAEEFAVFLNPKTTLTPHLCRKGCKHYDSVGDQKSADFNGSSQFFLLI